MLPYSDGLSLWKQTSGNVCKRVSRLGQLGGGAHQQTDSSIPWAGVWG